MIVTGNSMRPFLKHGRDKICMKKTDRKLRKGDIVFYRRENGQYVMHRILKCGDQSYTLLGDGQIVPESGIRQEQIFARITKVQVRGKMDRTGKIFGGDFLNISGFVFVVSGNLGFLFLQRCRI